jgi:hypothetical protein
VTRGDDVYDVTILGAEKNDWSRLDLYLARLAGVAFFFFLADTYPNCFACMDRATISNCISVVPDADKPPSESLSAAA